MRLRWDRRLQDPDGAEVDRAEFLERPETVAEWDCACAAGAPVRPLEPVAVDARGLGELLGGLSQSFIHKLRAAGRLPEPITLGSRVLWPVFEVECWTLAGAPPMEKWKAVRERELLRWRHPRCCAG
jgi:hypothetical protein